jgi:predicted HicB family RNase H-like nuclease
MSNGMKTIKVPEEVWQEAKILAAKQKLSLYELVTEALKYYSKKTSSVVEK